MRIIKPSDSMISSSQKTVQLQGANGIANDILASLLLSTLHWSCYSQCLLTIHFPFKVLNFALISLVICNIDEIIQQVVILPYPLYNLPMNDPLYDCKQLFKWLFQFEIITHMHMFNIHPNCLKALIQSTSIAHFS